MENYEQEHARFLRSAGAECAVLLKQNGAFPLSGPGDLALYGSGARRTVKGGTGSGEVNSRYAVTIEEGLEAAGFTITTTVWMDEYERVYQAARRDFVRKLREEARGKLGIAALDSMGAVMPEPEFNIRLRGAGDTAVYVLSRISGEGSDRQAVPGDILLTETEVRDILLFNEKYKNFLLVLNVGGVVDLSPVMEVGNILLLSQLGVETGSILADILLGKSAPSGRLTTTWTSWEDYPAVGQFGKKEDTRYIDGVYVGYRYFDSVGKKPLFPFGFGLGYTDFALTAPETKEEVGIVSLRCGVKNTGTRAGKEVVQLYVSPPEGALDKPFQSLAAFAKTAELQPGETEELSLSFDLRDLASYDPERSAWALEAGDYVLYLGRSSADTTAAAVLRLDGEVLVRRCRRCLGEAGFADWRPDARPRRVPEGLPVLRLDAARFETEQVEYALSEDVDPLMEKLSDEELCYMNIGAFDPKKSALSLVGDAGKTVAGAAGETAGCLREKGIPSLVMADGPAGLRLARRYTVDKNGGAHSLSAGIPESVLELLPAPAAFVMRHVSGKGKVKGEVREQNCTAIPIGTALAQSWNLAFAERCGDLVGEEMERFGVHLWLAPALNIHRDIRCGRNFEYFSEDPLIAGKFAAAITRGVQKHPGCGTTVKHFAANNQELNRYNNNSAVSERALREIYLRGFGIAVKESQPRALMTSYNLINGVHSSERRDLLQDILRAEFGYRGIVMTDWIMPIMNRRDSKYPAPDPAKIAAAGNDLTMPGGPGDLKKMLRGLQNGLVTRRQLQINATRVYRLARELTGR
ncbi:MAG: glycoside hydrolase family 3 C-terminal domain-containing protein [Oscillospiraceae bacterium]|nr:glycoside hydrolase family 3 C-terminal domain-containing protein [Oscillospiraceae bacterium]